MTVIRKIPFGNEIIGIRCNRRDYDVTDIAFMLWAPQPESFTQEERAQFDKEGNDAKLQTEI